MKDGNFAALAWGGVLGAGVLWGLGALVAQSLLEDGMAPASLALARFALGWPLLWWAHRRTRHALPEAPRLGPRERMLVAGTGVAMAANVSCWFVAIGHIGAALPTVVSICGAPLIVAAVSVATGMERPSLRLGAALVLALAGIGLIVWPAAGAAGSTGSGSRLAGLAWSLGSALCYALVVLGNARMPRALGAVSASAWGMGVASLCMLAVALPLGLTWPRGAASWAALLALGVGTTSIAYLAFAWGARRLPPTAAVVGTLVEPLVTVAGAAWLFGDALAPRQWLGALLLGLAVGVLARRR